MSKRYIVAQYKTAADVVVTICRPGPAPKTQWKSKHLGKSDSSVARSTGKYNHA